MLIITALLIGQLPYFSNFFSWQMTFFHELSHGLAALVGGGRMVKIELHFSGSGLCYTYGGLRWLIIMAGYAGAPFWGLMIYLSAGVAPLKGGHFLAISLAAVMIATGIIYARDIQTWTIIAAITLFYCGAVKFRNKLPLKFYLKLAGLYIILDSVTAPLALFGHNGANDAASLAVQTGLPGFFWILFWLGAAAGCLMVIWIIEGQTRPGSPTRGPKDQ